MPDSMRECLQRDMECEGLLECFHGLEDLDREVFGLFSEEGDALTVDEVPTKSGANARRRTGPCSD